MKFLCLCYYDTAAFARLSAEEAAKIEPACKPHDARLNEAKDMEEAKAVAAKHPAANFGEELGFAVEVRPCEMYEELFK
jgi:hypothetical protein